MDEPVAPADRQLNIARRDRKGWAVIEVAGLLQWPYAAQLTEVVPPAAPLSQTSILLDLTAVTSIDNTGIAVLASIAAQLQDTGRPIHVIVADDQLRRQLPRTAGLQNIFTSLAESTPWRTQGRHSASGD